MFRKEITPLSEGMIDGIAKTINKLQYVEEKASRPADSADGDVKAQDISGEEEVKADGSTAKAPARKGDQAKADSMEKVKEDASNDESDDGEGLDKVDPKAAKKKFANRKDKDLDNDGDTDSSDEYLHKRRKAIGKALAKEETSNFNQPITEKMGDDDWVHIARAGSFYNPKKDKIIGYSKSPKDPNRSPKIKSGANSAMRIGDAKKKGYAIKEEVELDEAKSDYTINHKTFSSAVQHAVEVAKKRGFEVDDEDYDRKVAMGPRKPSKGKTNSYSIALMKGGKPAKQKLQMQVYYDEGRYELNMYIS